MRDERLNLNELHLSSEGINQKGNDDNVMINGLPMNKFIDSLQIRINKAMVYMHPKTTTEFVECLDSVGLSISVDAERNKVTYLYPDEKSKRDIRISEERLKPQYSLKMIEKALNYNKKAY